MTLENSKVLHKHFLEIGRKDLAEQQEKNYPELKTVKETTDPTVPNLEDNAAEGNEMPSENPKSETPSPAVKDQTSAKSAVSGKNKNKK